MFLLTEVLQVDPIIYMSIQLAFYNWVEQKKKSFSPTEYIFILLYIFNILNQLSLLIYNKYEYGLKQHKYRFHIPTSKIFIGYLIPGHILTTENLTPVVAMVGIGFIFRSLSIGMKCIHRFHYYYYYYTTYPNRFIKLINSSFH